MKPLQRDSLLFVIISPNPPPSSIMLHSFELWFVLFLTVVLALTSVFSVVRMSRAYWEQTLPKKLPSSSSAPSKGSNSIDPSSSSKAVNVDGILTIKDGNV